MTAGGHRHDPVTIADRRELPFFMVYRRAVEAIREHIAGLAFTWIWDGGTTRQLIELDLEETDGITTVHFTHSGLLNEEAMRPHDYGWNRAFDNLERTLQAADPRR